MELNSTKSLRDGNPDCVEYPDEQTTKCAVDREQCEGRFNAKEPRSGHYDEQQDRRSDETAGGTGEPSGQYTTAASDVLQESR
ncbi:MAG TPA: hypothetical protein VGY66_26085 [Gemmataceae bacterium]|jgi:hypothetical protein|nr:hypothetical protein [Gemmataceae bacterium]